MKNKNDLWDTIRAVYYQASNEFEKAIHKRGHELVADPKLILNEAWEATKVDSENIPKLYLSNRKLTKKEIQHGFEIAERDKKLDKTS